MNRLEPDATFDCLYVIKHLHSQREGIAQQEVHLFAYLSCLLWIYCERPVSDWGYHFVGTEHGAPYSPEIDVALRELLERGFLRRIHELVGLTKHAEQVLYDLTTHSINKERAECLEAACSSTAAFSVGMVSSALAKEPELSRARAIPSSRFLLERAAQTQLYDQFEALRKALQARGHDLRLPAVVWLTALYQL